MEILIVQKHVKEGRKEAKWRCLFVYERLLTTRGDFLWCSGIQSSSKTFIFSRAASRSSGVMEGVFLTVFLVSGAIASLMNIPMAAKIPAIKTYKKINWRSIQDWTGSVKLTVLL